MSPMDIPKTLGVVVHSWLGAEGQATALLKTLLNQAGPPLIIDQPEEDLDNPVMLEIVEQVRLASRNAS